MFCTVSVLHASFILQQSLQLWFCSGGSAYFSVPLQLMGLRQSSSLSFRASWERVRALSLQRCSISCTNTETAVKPQTLPVLKLELGQHFQDTIVWCINTKALAGIHNACVGPYPLVLVSVGCHCFAVPDPLLSVTGQGEAVCFSEVLCIFHLAGQLQFQCSTFLLHLLL